MKELLFLAIIAAFLSNCGEDIEEPFSDVKIIGGSQVPHDPTKPSMYPSTIGILSSTGGCSGTRIGTNTYITATHCFTKASGSEVDGVQLYASNSYSQNVKVTNLRR